MGDSDRAELLEKVVRTVRELDLTSLRKLSGFLAGLEAERRPGEEVQADDT